MCILLFYPFCNRYKADKSVKYGLTIYFALYVCTQETFYLKNGMHVHCIRYLENVGIWCYLMLRKPLYARSRFRPVNLELIAKSIDLQCPYGIMLGYIFPFIVRLCTYKTFSAPCWNIFASTWVATASFETSIVWRDLRLWLWLQEVWQGCTSLQILHYNEEAKKLRMTDYVIKKYQT